ncbi:MAG: PfkB family carbohydrate kinase [Bifidobacteriaceae bacterium]|nr:PfkB family carbohydrate kinase [Bifidobacteriaceae bacterium]
MGGAGALGRLIHTGQAVADLVLRVPALPEAGGDVFASAYAARVGGGFNVMAAARRDGARVVYAGGHGVGPFGDMVRAALRGEDVGLLARADPSRDTGLSVALVDDAAERTFVSWAGAEAAAQPEALAAAAPGPGDVVYVTGYSLVHAPKRRALLAWLRDLSLADAVPRVLVDPSPLLAAAPAHVWRSLAPLVTWWSLNLLEAKAMAWLLGLPEAPAESPDAEEASPAALAAALRGTLEASVVVRLGAEGAVVAERAAGPDAPPVWVPGHPVKAVDTNGAGDAHCGVMAAALLRGAPLLQAVARANVAAALAVTRPGPATAPATKEIDAALGYSP